MLQMAMWLNLKLPGFKTYYFPAHKAFLIGKMAGQDQNQTMGIVFLTSRLRSRAINK